MEEFSKTGRKLRPRKTAGAEGAHHTSGPAYSTSGYHRGPRPEGGEHHAAGQHRTYSEHKPYGEHSSHSEGRPYGERKSYGENKPYGER
ncbi:MAG: hypothetical protein KBS55_03660, partial [Bacteroidales bacterium]|nr:hypothetical protein [Candidatus Cryptobacteroides aphodequi]